MGAWISGVCQELLTKGVADGLFAGAVIGISCDGEQQFFSTGRAELRPFPRPLDAETPFDLASMTKILCTTTVAMLLYADGALHLDQPAREILPDLPDGVTARRLLQHAAGFPAWRPFFKDLSALPPGTPATRERLLALARATPVTDPGQRAVYSDIGFLALGSLLERVGGERLDRLFARRVALPLGLDLRWGWAGAAATEDCPVRGQVQSGTVHDINAWWAGGVAGHAGLFGSAAGVLGLAEALLGAFHDDAGASTRFLPPRVVQEFWTFAGPGSHRLGWDSPTPGATSAGPRWPADGVGHLGFTGTSLWIAPRQRVCVALLTNRVHPVVEGGSVPGQTGPRTAAFRALRPLVHTAVVGALEQAGRWG